MMICIRGFRYRMLQYARNEYRLSGSEFLLVF
uniref:Uncharacterized protein n=1 Tax=Anguilla anguilla TaxID=7936 RepID=A0A0E9VNN2_ANGAN